MARKDTISQFAVDTIGIAIYENSAYVDPDPVNPLLPMDLNTNPPLVTLDIIRISDEMTVVDDGTAVRDNVGLYSFDIGIEVTTVKGDYKVVWTYTINGDPRTFEYEFTVDRPQPYWDLLDPTQKAVIEGIYFKLSDGFDSTLGGPYLWELPQSSFGLETIARLTTVDGMNYINFEGPKAFNPPYTFGGGTKKIPPSWYGLVQQAGFVETLKHLSRSYLEIPLPVNVTTAHLDRTRYSEMWMNMAKDEEARLLRQVHMIKRAMALGVRTRSKLLAGGIFPVSYLNPARPRWPYVLTRFY